jgi:hypothetical protein
MKASSIHVHEKAFTYMKVGMRSGDVLTYSDLLGAFEVNYNAWAIIIPFVRT